MHAHIFVHTTTGFARVKCQSCDADRLMAIICTGCLKATTIPSSNFTAELGRMTKSITNNTKLYYYKIRKIEYLTCPRCNHHFQQQKQRSQAHPGKSPGGVQPSGDSEQKNPRVGRNSTDSTSSIPTETGGNRSFFRSSLSSVSSPRASISSRRGSGFDVDGGYAYGDDDADAGVMGGMFDDDLNVGHTATNSQSTRHNGDNDVDDGLSTDGNLIACPKCNFFVYDDE